MFLHLDCRHYLGDRPCKFHRLCEGCPHYAPMGPRLLIIKLGALGDVVRTACLLPALAQWPEPPHVTWLTSPAALPLVQRMPGVDRALAFTPETILHLVSESFDIVYSLDKEPAPCAVAMQVAAPSKRGIGLSRYGSSFPLNDECEYYFRLGLDNEEKFHRNRKSYPQLLFEALGLEYRGERYAMRTTEADRRAADALLAAAAAQAAAPLIGINPGAGKVFANKAWREEGYVKLIRALADALPAARCLMLGGQDETDLIARIVAAAGPAAINPGAANDLGVFAALIERCALVVSGDTLAMHIALALGRRSIAIFGPTCEQEIDLFGLGEKLVTPIGCAPCYLRACDKSPNCQDLIPTDQVAQAALRQLAIAGFAPVPQPEGAYR